MPDLPIYGTGIWEYCCHVSNQRPQIWLVAKFGAKIRILKFGPYFGSFGLEFEKLLSYLKLVPRKKQKRLNLKPKMCDSGIFELGF